MSKPKNIVTLKLTGIQFTHLMELFDWRMQFVNVDNGNTQRLWAVVVRQTGGIPKPAYDLGETDQKPVEAETRNEEADRLTPKKRWWQR